MSVELPDWERRFLEQQPSVEAAPPEEPHPESYCHRCGGRNIVWSAPSPLWNAVMRGGSINGEWQFDEMICPICFAELAEEQGVASLWRLSADRVHVELETVTPSGRVWDETSQMWQPPNPPIGEAS